MGLDYSQKQLLSSPMHHHARSRRSRKLQIYAVATGFVSMLTSLATLFLRMMQ